MGCRDNKPKYNCGSKQNATCVFYDKELPKFSELEDCVTLEETTQELYENTQNILDNIDLEDLGKTCIDYSEFQEDKNLKVKEAFLTLEKEICELKNIDFSNGGIDVSKLDLKCLTDPCNNVISTEQQLIQILINEICILKSQIN